MIRATTPTHKFIFPNILPINTLDKIQITYSQIIGRGHDREDSIVLEKNLEDIDIDTENNTITVNFTQEETNKFREGFAEIQIRAKREDGQVIASQIIKAKVKKTLNKEIL